MKVTKSSLRGMFRDVAEMIVDIEADPYLALEKGGLLVASNAETVWVGPDKEVCHLEERWEGDGLYEAVVNILSYDA